jgi:branched-chain amino acid transport system substrate-binding protein
MLAEATRSTTWVWVVIGGFVVSLALIWHVVSQAIGSLPDETQLRLRGSLRANSRPIAVTAVVLTWTLAYLLYSVASVPIAAPAGEGTSTLAAGTSTDDPAVSVPGSDPVSGTATPDATVAGGGPAPSTAGAAGAPRTGAATKAGTATTVPANKVSLGVPAVNIKEPNLFSGPANTRGITSNTIKICGHAPLSYGALLNTKPEDLLVFWRWLNDKGGLFGRKFDVALQDDQYTAEGSVPAATACAEGNPFMIFGALGSDVIPPVRLWAEQNKELYLYGFTIKKGSESFKYSYTGTIQQEDLSRVLANVAVTQFPGKKVGLLWRNSANFQPGRDAFKRFVTDHGGKVVADVPVQKNQGSYTQEMITLQQSGAEVVFALEDAVTQLNMVKQAKTQQYNPQWLLFTYNIQTVTLNQDALSPPLRGANLTPAYECHVFDGPYASYANEIREFEAAYAKYSPNTDLCGITGDIAWQGWVGFKAFAGFFELCGRDCTRNRFAGIMEGGFQGAIGAACPADFARDPHHGGGSADLMEAYQAPSGHAAYRNTTRCSKAP